MKKIMKGRFGALKTCLLAGAVLAIAGCSSSNDSGGGGEVATSCVGQSSVSAGVVDITNNCDRTIIVLNNDNTTRFVLEPGATNRVEIGASTGFGACYSPSEPEFKSANEFECN